VRPMADVIQFPQKYDLTADLTLSISELCDGEDTEAVLSALTTVLIAVVAECICPKGHAETVAGISKLITEGLEVCKQSETRQ
jgi:hypothetical protein